MRPIQRPTPGISGSAFCTMDVRLDAAAAFVARGFFAAAFFFVFAAAGFALAATGRAAAFGLTVFFAPPAFAAGFAALFAGAFLAAAFFFVFPAPLAAIRFLSISSAW